MTPTLGLKSLSRRSRFRSVLKPMRGRLGRAIRLAIYWFQLRASGMGTGSRNLIHRMDTMTFPRLAIVGALSVLILLPLSMVGPVDAESGWFQYRGPHRDGKSAETGLARSWGADGPRVIWRAPLGGGFSPISIVGDRVYTMDSDDRNEYALCLDADRGKTVWRVQMGALFRDANGDGPRSGPTVDGGLVFFLASRGRLAALDRVTGKAVWQLEYPEAFGSELPTWGFSAAPLVDGDLLIIEPGGSGPRAVAALVKSTGEVRWTAQNARTAYSSPIALQFNGLRQFVFLLQEKIVALNREGEELWSVPFAPNGNIKPAMPLFIEPDRIMAAASYDIGAKVVRLQAAGDRLTAQEVWSSLFMRNHFNSSLSHNGHIYGFDAATFRCLDARTGERGWAKRGLGKGSLIFADGMLVVLSELGQLLLVDAMPEDYRELASHQVLEGRCWTPPSLWAGRLYVRNHTEIVCLDLRDRVSK